MGEIQDLPDELLVEIFAYLRLSHLKQARLVCKRWHRISRSECLIKTFMTYVHQYEELESIKYTDTRCLTLRMWNYHSRPNLALNSFWNCCGDTLFCLKINNMNMDMTILTNILKECKNLQLLSFVGSSLTGAVHPGTVVLPNLRSLELSYIDNLQSDTFLSLTAIAPYLNNIIVKRVKNLFTDEDLHLAFFGFLTKLAYKLTGIELDLLDLKDTHVQKIIKVIGSQLCNLTISCCYFSNNRFETIADKVNLKRLILNNCNCSASTLISPLFDNLAFLTHVGFYCTENVTDSVVASLRGLANLTGLDLSYCRNISDQGILNLFSGKKWNRMRDLRLGGLNITDYTIRAISPNLPNLKILLLSHSPYISNNALKHIFQYNQKIKWLSLSSLRNCNDFNVGLTVNALKGLIGISLNNLDVTDSSISYIKLAELEYIDIRSRQEVKEQCIMQMVAKCPSLQHILMSLGKNGKPKILTPKINEMPYIPIPEF